MLVMQPLRGASETLTILESWKCHDDSSVDFHHVQDVLGRQQECESVSVERLLFDEKDSRLAQDLVEMEKAGNGFKSTFCGVHLGGVVTSC